MTFRMKRIVATAWLLVLVGSVAVANDNLWQQPTRARRNIGLVFDKLRAGKNVTIAYMGGSIAHGTGASDANKTSWRAQVNNWFRTQFPKARINELNASVAGTDSLYAAIRARRDVVEYKPDLVFIEYAVSDAGSNEDSVKKSIEGIIRQLLAVSQPPEIVMVYATNNQRNACVEWHEEIANFYHLPAINLQELIWKQLESSNTGFSTLSNDGLNPNDEGHKQFARHIMNFLTEQSAKQSSSPIKVLPMPLLSDEMTYGELKAFAEMTRSPVWRTEATTDKSLPASLLTSDKAGTELTVTFEGTVVGLTFKMGPDAGMFECLIDGKPAPDPLKLVDAYDRESHVATRILAGGLSPGEHKLTIRIKAEKNAKSSGHNIRLGSFLIGGARPEKL